jgi:hypothetical protein
VVNSAALNNAMAPATAQPRCRISHIFRIESRTAAPSWPRYPAHGRQSLMQSVKAFSLILLRVKKKNTAMGYHTARQQLVSVHGVRIRRPRSAGERCMDLASAGE